MKLKSQRSNTLIFILKKLVIAMVMLSCGCGEGQRPIAPKEPPKKAKPEIAKGSGGMDNRGNPVK